MKYKLQDLPDIVSAKNIFFIGIKGVGMAPLAIIAKQAGFNIAGSDIPDEFITDISLNNEEILVFENFDIEDIKMFFEHYESDESLVITTGAHKGFDNPQAIWAKQKGINVISQGQALGVFMSGTIFDRDFEGVAVAGSHGKTTVSSLLSVSLVELGLDPTYAVGTGELFPVGSPGHFGRGGFFIAESDEYASEPVYDKIPKFLYQNPKYAIFNNVDFDHPDLFRDLDTVKEAFDEFALNIRSGGTLFLNGDDENLKSLKENITKDIRIVTFGCGKNNDFRIGKIVTEGFESKFTVYKNQSELGIFELNILGKHNAINSLPVIALLYEVGFSPTEIRNALKVFKGSKRRLEIIGKTKNGALVVDDYGHHPLEISTTIKALRNAFPKKRIVAIFQSHTYSRTKSLLTEFAKSFDNADNLCLLPIFKSQRDTESDVLSEKEFVGAFENKKGTIFIDNFPDMVKYISQNHDSEETLIVTIGAGEVYKIGYELVKT